MSPLSIQTGCACGRRYGRTVRASNIAYSAANDAIGLAEVSVRSDYVNAGCRELASDALLDNVIRHVVHRGFGSDETERVVYFRRKLA